MRANSESNRWGLVRESQIASCSHTLRFERAITLHEGVQHVGDEQYRIYPLTVCLRMVSCIAVVDETCFVNESKREISDSSLPKGARDENQDRSLALRDRKTKLSFAAKKSGFPRGRPLCSGGGRSLKLSRMTASAGTCRSFRRRCVALALFA